MKNIHSMGLRKMFKNSFGNGCATVSGAVCSDTRRPGFESNHLQFIYFWSTVVKTKEEKETTNGPFLKISKLI